MKLSKEHKALVAKATPLRQSINDGLQRALDLQNELDATHLEVTRLRSELSIVEQESADSGLSTSDLHAAVKL